MILKYISNRGIEVDLNRYPYRVLPSDLLDYEWDVISDNSRINSFEKTFVEKKINIDIFTTTKSALENANRLTDIFEADILDGKPGRLFVNEQYLQCYICGSVKKNNWKTIIQQCEYKLITDKPFWISEKKLSFGKYNGSGSNNFLNYPYNYPYNYTGINKGFSQINNEHYNSVHFRMTIYGPCVNPMIIIGGHTYIINTIVGKNEYLEIDSRNRTVIKTLIDGAKVNEFNNRGFESETFKKIPPGVSPVNWSGEYGFDIVLFYERSEPKWTQK